MKTPHAFIAIMAVAALVTAARSGHELPVYPSYYPHEIRIESVPPESAVELLRGGKIQAHVGSGLRFSGALPDGVAAVESLGAYVVVHVNPTSPLATDEPSACLLVETVVRDIAGRGGDFVFHPYPVTPFHGDYLHHVDLAAAAKARLSTSSSGPAESALRDLKVRADGLLVKSLVRSDWQTEGSQWDAAVEEASAADLVASATAPTNGWLGPPWVRTGWFQAYALLADPAGGLVNKQRAQANVERLQTGDNNGAAERINLERDLVRSLAAGCRRTVAGYTVKREYINTEFSAGIENIAYDAIEGLNSPLFIRTVKLKDFPWNGWLMLGTEARPDAAWNPIAGFGDRFGRLAWFALGDPAAVPSPYESAWMLNRISDVQSTPSP